jgi:predicted aldo/keto reductase-like oxidoreductase
MDKPAGDSGRKPTDVDPVLAEIKTMHDKGRGVIGMKICANGDFSNDPAARQESVRFAINNPHIHSIVIGMRSTREVDENISLVNQALAASA